MKKKIVFFMFSLGGGGAERTVLNIINNLNKELFNVTLVVGTQKKNDYIYLVSDEVNVKSLGCNKLRHCLFKLRRVIIDEKPDLLFSTLIDNNIILLLARLLSFKSIPTIVREASNRSQSGKVTIFNKIVTMILYNLLSIRIIALSEGVKQSLIKNFHIRKNKIKVIYNPIEVQNIKKMSMESDVNISNNNVRRLIAVGRLVEAKDYITLLKAFKILANKGNIQLIILGEGPMKQQLISKVKELNIEKSVFLLGFKKNPYKYINHADVFVLSSKWEGFSHVIVEAMAVGTPVVSTNCNSGPPEIIKDNKYGLLVPKENPEALSRKIIGLLNNEELKNRYIKQGFKRANDFDAKIIIKEYEDMFNEVLEEK